MHKTIIHVDMDAFFAAVESRDNPALAGKPLIIGALPQERGVVSTCSYEARKYGVRSAMNIKEAYRRCPNGIYMHPDIQKYHAVTQQLHAIWCSYTDMVEYISLDEGYLDVSGSLRIFGDARTIAMEIKRRTKEETGLTCSAGVGYSMASAKLASEERKPNGFFEIPDAASFQALVMERDVSVLAGIGVKSAEKLRSVGICKVRDILGRQEEVVNMFGKHGAQMVALANGIDTRVLVPHHTAEAKSIGREQTLQRDTIDFDYLKSFLRLFAKELSIKLRTDRMYCQTVTLKVTYGNMKSITRSKSGEPTCVAGEIYQTVAALLDAIEHKPVRLVGLSLSGFTREGFHQLSLQDIHAVQSQQQKEELEGLLLQLQQKYGAGIIKSGNELAAEKRIRKEDPPD